jgi:NADH/F420H2 dehydrogenase subunit C
MTANDEIKRQADLAQSKLGASIEALEWDRAGCPVLWVKRDEVIRALKTLKDVEGLEFRFLADLTAYDDQGTAMEAQGRFVVVYNLFSPQYKTRLRVKTRAGEGVAVPTATGLWDSANWAEREVYDMFGVKFEGHPDLRRILMDVRWEGHPLRKDYPLRKYQLFNDPEPIPEHLLRD